jgi:hypothetical protein
VKTLKRHLSVANVLSIVAVFIALSATAVAATKLAPNQVKSVNIARQAVTNAKIKTQAVTSGKIKNLGIVSGDLAANSVASSKIRNNAVTNSKLGTEAVDGGSLAKKAETEAKIGPEAVTTGKLGNESISQAKLSATLWRQLLKNVTYVTEASISNSEDEKTITATCPAGKEVIGGGGRINAPVSVNVALSQSYPSTAANNSRNAWIATAREPAIEAGSWQVVAYAICAEL